MTYLRILATAKPAEFNTRGPLSPMTPEDQAFWDWRAASAPKCEGYGKR